VIHQVDAPRWEVVNFEQNHFRSIHLSYHNGDHYCSVRMIGDYSGIPKLVEIRTKTPGGKKSDEIETDKEKIVASSTGYDIETVRKSLNEFNGDVDATIEYLLAIRQAEMRSAEAAEAAENKKEDVKNGKEETTNVISSSPPSSENATSLTMEPPEKTVSNEKEKKSNISFEGMNIEDLKQLLQGFNRQSEILQATIKDTGHRSDVETYKATYVAISKDIEELKQELAKQEKNKKWSMKILFLHIRSWWRKKKNQKEFQKE